MTHPHAKNIVTKFRNLTVSQMPTDVQNFIPLSSGFLPIVWSCMRFDYFLCLKSSPTTKTPARIFVTHNTIRQKTRFRARMCLLCV